MLTKAALFCHTACDRSIYYISYCIISQCLSFLLQNVIVICSINFFGKNVQY